MGSGRRNTFQVPCQLHGIDLALTGQNDGSRFIRWLPSAHVVLGLLMLVPMAIPYSLILAIATGELQQMRAAYGLDVIGKTGS